MEFFILFLRDADGFRSVFRTCNLSIATRSSPYLLPLKGLFEVNKLPLVENGLDDLFLSVYIG